MQPKLLMETFAYLRNTKGTYHILSEQYEHYWMSVYLRDFEGTHYIFLQNNRILTGWWTMQNITYVTSLSRLITMTTLGSRLPKTSSPSSILHRLTCKLFKGLRCQKRWVKSAWWNYFVTGGAARRRRWENNSSIVGIAWLAKISHAENHDQEELEQV